MLFRFALSLVLTLTAMPVFSMASQQHDSTKFSKDQIRTRLLDACVMQLSSDPKYKDTLSNKCHCYASATIKVLNESEMDSFRKSQNLNSSGKDKAIAAQEKCGIK